MKLRFRALLLFLLLFTRTYAQIDLQRGLLACYSFSGNANDGTGNNHHGTVFGASLTTDRFGSPNSAYAFNGSNYIRIPPAPFKNSNYTYSFWASTSSPIPDEESAVIFSIGSESNWWHQTVNFSNSYASAGFVGINAGGYNVGSPTTTSVQSGQMPSVGRWYHVVSVRDDQKITLYIDGIFIGSTSTNLTQPYYGTDTRANIGARCSFIQYFTGKIDDVALYNRALSSDEVYELFISGAPCNPDVRANSPTICAGEVATLNAVGGTQFRWYATEASSTPISSANPFTTPILTETTAYFVAVVSNGIESKRVKVTVTVNPKPQITCTLADSAFVGIQTLFTASSTGGTPPYHYSLSIAGNDRTFSGSTLLSFDSPGLHMLSAKVTDSEGCSDICSEEVIVLPNVNAISPTICAGEVATLEAVGGTEFRWYATEASSTPISSANPFTTPILTETTAYFVTAATNGLVSKRLKVTVTVNPKPQITCTFADSVFVGRKTLFTASTTGGTPPYHYSLSVADKDMTFSGDSLLVLLSPGLQMLSVKVTDSEGCADICSEEVIVLPENIFIPNYISPDNGDMFNQLFTLFLKLSERNYIPYDGPDTFNMRVFNRWGREVYQTDDAVLGWKADDNVSGVYYYFIRKGEDHYKGWVHVVK